MRAEDDVSKLTGDLYRQWEKSMETWWDGVLESPEFLKGMGKNLEAQGKARKSYEEGVDKTMGDLHLPSRKDVIRLAKVASMLEDKLLSVEDQVLAHGDALGRIEKDTLKARIDAAEALVAVHEKLGAIEARLDRVLSALEGADAKKKTKP